MRILTTLALCACACALAACQPRAAPGTDESVYNDTMKTTTVAKAHFVGYVNGCRLYYIDDATGSGVEHRYFTTCYG